MDFLIPRQDQLDLVHRQHLHVLEGKHEVEPLQKGVDLVFGLVVTLVLYYQLDVFLFVFVGEFDVFPVWNERLGVYLSSYFQVVLETNIEVVDVFFEQLHELLVELRMEELEIIKHNGFIGEHLAEHVRKASCEELVLEH